MLKVALKRNGSGSTLSPSLLLLLLCVFGSCIFIPSPHQLCNNYWVIYDFFGRDCSGERIYDDRLDRQAAQVADRREMLKSDYYYETQLDESVEAKANILRRDFVSLIYLRGINRSDHLSLYISWTFFIVKIRMIFNNIAQPHQLLLRE